MGGSASRSCTNFRHVVIANARVASLDLGGSPTVFLSSLHQVVGGTAALEYKDPRGNCSTTELKEGQAVFNDMLEEKAVVRIEINDVVEEEEAKEGNLREECASTQFDTSLKVPDSPHPQSRFTAFEIPIHIGPCAMLTPMKLKDSPSHDNTEVESYRPVETASTVTYSHSKTHSIALLRRHVPHRDPSLKKSTSPLQGETLCQKYPQVYKKARENVLPLITNSTPSTQTNDSTSLFRSESMHSLKRLNTSSIWQANRLDRDKWTYCHNRMPASRATSKPKLPQNPSARRLKPIDSSMIPTNPAAGDQIPFPSKPRKPKSSMLPPLTRSGVGKIRPICRSSRDGSEVGLGASCNKNGESSLPSLTCFSSPRVKGADPSDPFTLQMEHGDSEESMQRDRLIFRNTRSVREASCFKQCGMDEIQDSAKHYNLSLAALT